MKTKQEIEAKLKTLQAQLDSANYADARDLAHSCATQIRLLEWILNIEQ